MVFSGIASGNLVAMSTILRIYLYPLVDLGSIGPAISTLIDLNGSPTSGRCPKGALVSSCRPSPSEHKSQLLTCLLTSFNIDGQKKTALIFSCVFFTPWCADIRDSCTMCRTLLLSFSGIISCNLTPSFNTSFSSVGSSICISSTSDGVTFHSVKTGHFNGLIPRRLVSPVLLLSSYVAISTP